MKNFIILSFLILTTGVFGQNNYTYDNLNRLIQVTCTDGSISSYQYDAVGNRMRVIITTEVSLPEVETLTTSVITPMSAIVGGNVISSGGATVNERGVYWSTSSNPETSGTKLQVGSGIGLYSTSITGLQSATLYFVKAYAINTEGIAYGEEQQFITLTSAPELYVLNLQVNPVFAGLAEGAGEYAEGAQINLNAVANQGYAFINWTDQSGSMVSESGNFNYTMLAEDVALVANFSDGFNYTVSGRLFHDINTNGVYDPNEDAPLSAINDWEVHLDGVVSMSVTPNIDGTYTFTDIPSGEYQIHLTVPKLWTVTNPFYDGIHHINPGNRQNLENIDFACYYLQRGNSDPEVIYFPNGQKTGDNTAGPGSQAAPSSSFPMDNNHLPVSAIHIKALPEGFEPDTIRISKDYITQLVVSHTKGYQMSIIIRFDDPELNAIVVGLAASETRMITFKSYNLIPGKYYDFYDDGFGSNDRGTLYIEGENMYLPLVSTTIPNNITSSTAMSGGNITSSGGSALISRGIVWNSVGDPSLSNYEGLTIEEPGMGIFESLLSGLTPSTTYYLKAYATNNNGTAYGEIFSFETMEEPLCNPNWTPIPNLQFNMQVIAQIVIENAVSINANDVLGAFVGDECRGIASPLEGLGMAFLSVGSNQGSGELVELKIWNSTLCEFCDAGPGFTFVNLGEVGTFDKPLQVSCITDVDLNFNFGQGYTWFSQNLTLENPHPNAFFEGLVVCNNDRLISQSGFNVYYNGSWNGTIAALNPSYSYRLKICEAKAFTATDPPAEIVPIALNSGYTWMGYLPQTCLPVNVALTNMNPAPTANDRLVGQGSFASYIGSQWLGSLTTLCPGAGYVIKLANPATLVYPEVSAKAKMFNSLEAELRSPTHIKSVKNLQHSMTVLGQLELPGGQYSNNPDDRIYAYANGQCVGMANPMEAENGLIFLSVGENSDQAQQISFKIWLDAEKQLYEANEALTFVPLKGTGAYENPFKFTLGQLVDSENDWFIGEPYPNPFNEETVVPVYLNEPSTLMLKLYNTMGQIVYTSEKSFNTAGKHEFLLKKEQLNAGVYSLSIQILNQKQFLSKSKTLIIN